MTAEEIGPHGLQCFLCSGNIPFQIHFKVHNCTRMEISIPPQKSTKNTWCSTKAFGLSSLTHTHKQTHTYTCLNHFLHPNVFLSMKMASFMLTQHDETLKKFTKIRNHYLHCNKRRYRAELFPPLETNSISQLLRDMKPQTHCGP